MPEKDLVAGGFFSILNQLPEGTRIAQLLVFRATHQGAKEEIAQRIGMNHALHHHAFISFYGEVDAIVLRAETKNLFTIALNHAKTAVLPLFRVEIIIHLEGLNERELVKRGKRRKLMRTYFIKYNLMHANHFTRARGRNQAKKHELPWVTHT